MDLSKLSNEEYGRYVGEKERTSPLWKDMAWAFCVGGLICTAAQVVINLTDLTSGKILVLFMLIGIGLTALGLYQPLVEFAGAGATVPICGFGYLLANGAMKGAEQGLFTALTGSLAAASAGVTAAIVFSFLMSVIFKSHTKHN